jgi:hypothetical protein
MVGDISINDLLQNISFAALFVALFYWTLRTNASREERYLKIIDCYGVQLEAIAASLKAIQEQTAHLVKTAGHEDKED